MTQKTSGNRGFSLGLVRTVCKATKLCAYKTRASLYEIVTSYSSALYNHERVNWMNTEMRERCLPVSMPLCGIQLIKPIWFLRLRLMFDVVPLPHDWPVEVNYLEAKAFCAWKGADFRLPTEAEHHVMRGSSQVESNNRVNGKHNTDMQYGSSTVSIWMNL